MLFLLVRFIYIIEGYFKVFFWISTIAILNWNNQIKREMKITRDTNFGKPCGRIFQEYGLRGHFMELRDAATISDNGFDVLGNTDFGNDRLMSMLPYEGFQV